MTCVNTRNIIEKYGELAQGDSRSDERRIVLDKSMTDKVKKVFVFNGHDLLKRFLSYVTDASKEVKDTERPILVLVFGYGVERIESITIDSTGVSKICPSLTRQKFNEALQRHNPNPNVAMLVSSCFGGGWTQTSFLNITAMVAVPKSTELLSWPQIESAGRCCGSRYSTGVAKALIEMEVQGLNMLGDEGEKVVQFLSFAALVATIHTILTKRVDVREKNENSFSAKDNVWNMEWRARIGFHLTSYLEKWESLEADRGQRYTG